MQPTDIPTRALMAQPILDPPGQGFEDLVGRVPAMPAHETGNLNAPHERAVTGVIVARNEVIVELGGWW